MYRQTDMFAQEQANQERLKNRKSILPALINLANHRIRYFNHLIEKIDTNNYQYDPINSISEIRTGYVNGLVNAKMKYALLQAEYESIKEYYHDT